MTWALGPTTNVVEAIDSDGKPFHVGPPELPAAAQQSIAQQSRARLPACCGDCGQSDRECPHPDLCSVSVPPVDRDLQRVIAWSLIGFWGVLLWWVLS